MHLRLKLTVFEETTIAIFWACIVKYISLSKEFESILTLLKKKEVLKIHVKDQPTKIKKNSEKITIKSFKD
jgi:hypothetical protein